MTRKAIKCSTYRERCPGTQSMSGIQLRIEAEVYNRIRRYHCVRGGARIMKVTSRSVVHLPEAVPILPDLAASGACLAGW